MQKAIKCFKENDLTRALKMFENLESQLSDSEELYQNLSYQLKISKKIHTNKSEIIIQKILNLLCRSEKNEALISFVEQEEINTENLSFKMKSTLLKAYKSIGKIEEVRERVEKYSEELIEKKIYNEAEDFYNWVEKENLSTLKTYFSELIFYIDVNNTEKIIKSSNKIENLVTMHWNKVTIKKKTKTGYINHLLGILQIVNLEDAALRKLVINLKVKLHSLGKKVEITNKELIEYIINNSKDSTALALLLPSIKDQFLRLDLKEIVLEFDDFDVKQLNKYDQKIAAYFEKKTNIQIIKETENKISRNYEFDSPYMKPKLNTEEIYKKYIVEDLDNQKFEFEAKAIVKYEQCIDADPNAFIVTLIDLQLYGAAITLIDSLKTDSNLVYLKARVLFYQKKYLDVITHINEKINFNKLNEIESVPYYYLKAESYAKLDKHSEAQNLYSIIMTLNPSFRNLKERLGL